MFWRKKKVEQTEDSKILLAMVLLHDEQPFNIETFTKDFTNHYSDSIEKPSGDNTLFAFTLDGETVGIGYMPVPVPAGDIEGTAKYAYNWVRAVADIQSHKSHLIVSLMQGGEDYLKRFKLFTQVICSLLRTTNSIGVYKGNQSLLIPKSDYLNEAAGMSNEYLPLNLWIYFGLQESESGNSGYTYGLKAFGKTEMEIVHSHHTLEDIRAFLFNITHYVLEYDVTLQEGETIGGSEEERITIGFSKGRFVEGNTFKIVY